MIWRSNVRKLQCMNVNVSVNICLTKFLLKKDPKKVLQLLNNLDISIVNLERLTRTGNAALNDWLIPSYEQVDIWLCKLYEASKDFPKIKNKLFDDIRFAINKDVENCRAYSCCKNTMTINANGTIGVCPNDAQINIIGDFNTNIKEMLHGKCSSCYIKKECLICDDFDQCFGSCPQMEWQGDICPYPHKLASLIKREKI
jgi:radical SAM protein with 4Fe4S-binding SPASM domain